MHYLGYSGAEPATKEISFDKFVHAVSNSTYHGFDLSLMILSKMLKVVIAFVHLEYIWMSAPDVNVREALVVLVYDGHKCLYGTGMPNQ